MTATARERLAALRTRGQIAQRRPVRAQGYLDEIQFPWNVRDLINSTDADYERVNLAAKGDPSWDIEMRSWRNFANDNKSPGWTNSSQETVQEIRRRQARLVAWQEKLSKKGIDTGPTATVSTPSPLVDPTYSPWTIAIVIALVVAVATR